MTVWTGKEPVPREVFLKQVAGADAIYCLLTDKVDKEVLDAAGKSLKVISTMSVGLEHIDLEEVIKRDIKVGYTPGVLTDATAELTVGLLLVVARRMFEANEEAKRGGWQSWSPFWMCGNSLSGSTVGIVGFGRIGFKVASILKGFDVKKILYFSRSEKEEAKQVGAKKANFDDLLKESDYICVTLSLTKDTFKIFNLEAFKMMKRSAIIVNTSRGEVLDQDALIYSLENKLIAGAGLDVSTPEPLPVDNPLFKMKNCVIMPHIGSATVSCRNEMALITAKNILAGLKNEKMPAELGTNI